MLSNLEYFIFCHLNQAFFHFTVNLWMCVYVCVHTRAKSLQSCLTLGNPMDCSPPGSSVHGILQAGVLEWVAMPSSRGSSRPRDGTCASCVSSVADGFLTTGEALAVNLFPANA